MPDPVALKALLDELESTLRALGTWHQPPPAPAAFESQLPFSADTMAFTEWLQWVFIARFRALLDGEHALPSECQIAPMAEESLRDLDGNTAPVLAVLARIDAQFD